jgi:nucleoside-diphosphate-sugar epimerase
MLLSLDVAEVVVVDNLLSAGRGNVFPDRRVEFIEGSIADDTILARLQDDLDFVFHLATYHGNENSIADPLADRGNNLITTLKLYERVKDFRKLKKVVYAASGCTLAPHTIEFAEPVVEDGPIPLELDSPYQVSKAVDEFYSVYYHNRHGLPTVGARFQNVYGPSEILGVGQWRGTPATVWWNVTPTFVYQALKQMPLTVENGGVATPDFIYVDDIVRGLPRCAVAGLPLLQPGPRGGEIDSRPRGPRESPDRQYRAHRARSAARMGPVRPAGRQHGEGPACTQLRGAGAAGRSCTHDRMDAYQPFPDRGVHRKTLRLHAALVVARVTA